VNPPDEPRSVQKLHRLVFAAVSPIRCDREAAHHAVHALDLAPCCSGRAGLGLFAYGSLDERPTLEGIGIGLAASTAVLLGLDLTAEGRGDAYLTRLRGFQPTVTTSGLYLGYTTVF
jgi:hypothetical protein